MQTTIVSFHAEGNLALLQFKTDPANTFNYIPGSIAMEKKYIEVTESGEGGTVNTLHIANTSEEYVFFLDGDILLGAKQNRVVNSSMLLAPKHSYHIPVSCIERGRWAYRTRLFDRSPHIVPHSLRSLKMYRVGENLRSQARHVSDQGEIWKSVSGIHMKLNTSSQTDDLEEAYKQKMADIEKLSQNFKLSTDANGLAAFVSDSLLSADIFNRKDVFAEYFPRLVKSVSLEMLLEEEKKSALSPSDAEKHFHEFFTSALEMPREKFAGIGVGTEKRFGDDQLTGLALEYETHLIHFTAMNLAPTRKRDQEQMRA